MLTTLCDKLQHFLLISCDRNPGRTLKNYMWYIEKGRLPTSSRKTKTKKHYKNSDALDSGFFCETILPNEVWVWTMGSYLSNTWANITRETTTENQKRDNDAMVQNNIAPHCLSMYGQKTQISFFVFHIEMNVWWVNDGKDCIFRRTIPLQYVVNNLKHSFKYNF